MRNALGSGSSSRLLGSVATSAPSANRTSGSALSQKDNGGAAIAEIFLQTQRFSAGFRLMLLAVVTPLAVATTYALE